MKLKYFVVLLLSVFTLQSSAQYYRLSRNAVRCLRVEFDGSVTLRAVGEGKKKKDAVEQAKRNAVYAVIFQGVRVDGGQNAELSKPLILERDAEKKYAEQLYSFFVEEGRYTEFVSDEDRKRRSDVKLRDTKIQETWETTVRVDRAGLALFLKDEGFIK
jgi:hypothetical protein